MNQQDIEEQLLQIQQFRMEIVNVRDALERQLNNVDAIMLDAPQEPPIEIMHQMPEPRLEPQRLRKERSFWTISKQFHAQPERSALVSSAWRAVQFVQPEERSEYFANFLINHMNSKNYPNGAGLPERWDQF